MDPIQKRELKRQAWMRLSAQRRRAGQLRGRVVALSLICFAVLWGVVFAQMATGNDPVLSAKEQAAATRTAANPSKEIGPPNPGEGEGSNRKAKARAEEAVAAEEAALELEPEVAAGEEEFVEEEPEVAEEEAEFVEEEPEFVEEEPEVVEEEPLVTSQS